MTEEQARLNVVSVAQSYLGYNEKDGTDDIIIKKYNSIKPKGSYTMKMSDSWCAAFASVVGNEAGFSEIIPIECSCERMINKFKELGRWEEDGTIIPKVGDYIFYNWDDSTQPNDGWADHVGIVVSVEGRNLKVIEGNYHDEVGYRKLKVAWGFIRGYGLPDYSKVSSREENLIVKGDKVRVTNAVTYTGKKFKLWYKEYDVIEVSGDRVVIGIGNKVTCAINIRNLTKV